MLEDRRSARQRVDRTVDKSAQRESFVGSRRNLRSVRQISQWNQLGELFGNSLGQGRQRCAGEVSSSGRRHSRETIYSHFEFLREIPGNSARQTVRLLVVDARDEGAPAIVVGRGTGRSALSDLRGEERSVHLDAARLVLRFDRRALLRLRLGQMEKSVSARTIDSTTSDYLRPTAIDSKDFSLCAIDVIDNVNVINVNVVHEQEK